MLLKPGNLLFTHASNVREICAPLFRGSPIIYFEFARFTLDGKLTMLSTYPEFAELVIKNHLYFTRSQFNGLHRYSMLNSSYIPGNFNFNKYEMITHLSKYNFKVDHFFCISSKSHDAYELYVFAANANNNLAMDYYLNNINFLDNFILYFREKVKKMLAKQETKSIITLMNFNDTVAPEISSSKIMPQKFKIDRWTDVNINNMKVHLTQRELQHLYYLSQGYTAKEVAKILSISNRTVEVFINKLRKKLSCHSKLELIEVFQQSDIAKYINVEFFE